MLANGHATDYLFVGNIVYTVSLPVYCIFLEWHVCGFYLSLPLYKVFVIIISNFWSIYYRFLKDCGLEIKRRLPLGRKAMINLDSILKSRDITLLINVCMVKAMVFSPVVMYRCKSWTIKKAEHQRTDAFELWCWRRLLRVPWIARRSNQSILKEIDPDYSLEGLSLKLKLKLQYYG